MHVVTGEGTVNGWALRKRILVLSDTQSCRRLGKETGKRMRPYPPVVVIEGGRQAIRTDEWNSPFIPPRRRLSEAAFWVVKKGEPYKDPAFGKVSPRQG